MNKRIVLDVQTMVDLFDMDGTPSLTLVEDYLEFSWEETIKFLFPSH